MVSTLFLTKKHRFCAGRFFACPELAEGVRYSNGAGFVKIE